MAKTAKPHKQRAATPSDRPTTALEEGVAYGTLTLRPHAGQMCLIRPNQRPIPFALVVAVARQRFQWREQTTGMGPHLQRQWDALDLPAQLQWISEAIHQEGLAEEIRTLLTVLDGSSRTGDASALDGSAPTP